MRRGGTIGLKRFASGWLAATTALIGIDPALAQPAAIVSQTATPGPIANPLERSATPSPSATLSLPAQVEGQRLATITAEVTVTDVVAASPADLADALGSRIDERTATALRSLGSGLAPISRVRETGLIVRLDPATISIAVEIPASIRGTQTFTPFSREAFDGRERIQPSDFAFGLTGALLATSRMDRNVDPAVSLGLAGFVNIGGADGLNLIFGGDFNFSGELDLFERDRVILFKDDPVRAIRYSGGDLVPLQSRLAGSVELLGMSYERNYQELQPTRNVRPVGRRAFVLERRSMVEVYVNGALVQSFMAEPGPVNIRDIPAIDLSSNVTIVVDDTLGRREIESFTIGNDIFLLARGFSEFSGSIGFLRDPNAFGFDYSNDPVASLYYSRGITENLTLTGHALLGEPLQNVGAGAGFAFLGGVALLEVAGSRTRDDKTGVAIGLSYRGDPFGAPDGNLNLRADYQSQGFRNATELSIADIKFDLAADYSFSVTDRTSVNFGGSYVKRYQFDSRDVGVFAGLQHRFGPMTLGVTVRHSERAFGRSDTGILFTLTRLFGRRISASANYDTLTDSGRIEVRQRRGLDLPEVEWALRGVRTQRNHELGGNFRYATSRLDGEADLIQLLPRHGGDQPLVGQVRLQSGIAFADGTLAIGRDPAQGFAIVRRHETLENARVTVNSGTVGRELARADTFGPAVAPILGAFRPQELTIGVVDAPPGYSIGAGSFVLEPGARSGFAIEVGGSAHFVVLAVLRDAEGQPLALTTGRAVNSETGESVALFTNRNGRAALSGIQAGRYRAELDNSDLRFEFEVRESDQAIKNLGEITLESRP